MEKEVKPPRGGFEMTSLRDKLKNLKGGELRISQLEKWIGEQVGEEKIDLINKIACDYTYFNHRTGLDEIYCAYQKKKVDDYCGRKK